MCFINAAAGPTETGDRVTAALEALRQAKVIADVRAVEGHQVEQAAREALAAGAGVVIVGGGDGTVSAAASVLAGSGAALAILPTGTFNHFARTCACRCDLRTPHDWSAITCTAAETARRR